MFNELIKKISAIDKSVINLIKNCLKYSFLVSLLGTYILSISETGYEIGLVLFQTGLIFSANFIVSRSFD